MMASLYCSFTAFRLQLSLNEPSLYLASMSIQRGKQHVPIGSWSIRTIGQVACHFSVRPTKPACDCAFKSCSRFRLWSCEQLTWQGIIIVGSRSCNF